MRKYLRSSVCPIALMLATVTGCATPQQQSEAGCAEESVVAVQKQCSVGDHRQYDPDRFPTELTRPGVL